MNNAPDAARSASSAAVGNEPVWPVRPLTRTRQTDGSLYCREPDVETQVRALSGQTERIRRLRLTADVDRAWEDAERLREETLVYFLRECARRGDEDTAWRIADTLIDRVTGHVQRKIARWRLTPDEADDCTRDLVTALCEALFDQDARAEFWEVRFWVCLDRRLWNLIEKRQATVDAEVSPGDAAEGDGEGSGSGDAETSLFARIAEQGPGPAAQAEYAEAFAQLNMTERRAVYLVFIEGLPEESDDPGRLSAARVMGVTGRSVRNYLRRAREKLASYYQG